MQQIARNEFFDNLSQENKPHFRLYERFSMKIIDFEKAINLKRITPKKTLLDVAIRNNVRTFRKSVLYACVLSCPGNISLLIVKEYNQFSEKYLII